MMTVHQVSGLTGVSIRTLQYYDRIGLLKPAGYTEAGYRLYDGASLERLQQILLFRELEFPLREIRAILESPGFDRDRALDQQIELLRLKKERLEGLIALAREIRSTGGKNMTDFSAFDTTRLDEYAARARASWGDTPAYQEYERRAVGRTQADNQALTQRMMAIFAELGALRGGDPAAREAQELVRRLRDFITGNFYTCTDEILAGLGQMYAAGGEMTENIDCAGGGGTAAFAAEAIRIFCSK